MLGSSTPVTSFIYNPLLNQQRAAEKCAIVYHISARRLIAVENKLSPVILSRFGVLHV
jgi:hypothetical protein